MAKKKKPAIPVKKIVRSAEWYSRALQGDKNNLGLRSVARGFSSRDGLNLTKGLTRAQKKKVEKAYHELKEITAQPRFVYRAKSTSKKEKARMKQAQQLTQSQTKTDWKVALIPHTPRKLKSGKFSKPKIYFSKESVTIQEYKHKKIYVTLNPVSLVKNPRKEIAKAIERDAPKAQRFAVKAGENEMPVLHTKTNIATFVISLMEKYDGESDLPDESGNRGDAPKNHHWKKWLKQLVAYDFPKPTKGAIAKAVNTFDDARRELQRERRNERAREKYEADQQLSKREMWEWQKSIKASIKSKPMKG